MASNESRIYARLVAPVRGKIIVGVVLTILSSISNFLPYYAIVQVAQEVLERGIPSFETLIPWIALAICGALFGRFFFAIGTGICHYADADFRVNARTILTEHLSKIPLGWFSANSSSEVKQGATDDVLNMHQSVGHAPVDITSAILTPLIPLAYLFTVDWRVAFILLAFFVIVLAAAAPFMFKDYTELNSSYNASLVELSSSTVEMVDGISVVKTFGSSSHASQRFRDAVSALVTICYSWTKRTASPFSITAALFSPAAMLVVLLSVSLLFITQGWLTLSQCVPFLVLGVGIPVALINIFNPFRFLRQSMQSAEHLGSILSVEPLKEPDHPQTIEDNALDISFDKLSFSYSDDASPALQDIEVTLTPGTVTALVGLSGSGKTTFARLIPRFWDPTKGSLSFNQIDLRNMDTSHVLSHVAIVFQDTVLLRESIRDNIRLGQSRASEAEVIEVAKKAQIHDRILEFPSGYDTVVGSSDGNLSGGEMQRVAIARAMLQDASILVLDEATAHADPENEVAIQKALSNLARGRTTIVIAHRLNTITHADQILVLDQGRIVEAGTHSQLLSRKGRYESLWRTQHIDTVLATAEETDEQTSMSEGSNR
ncbi:MAG: ABC transporter ATP-binding protein [Raoultibacter sp.]|jgi:ATP-binding cassette subfamily B protein IrtA